MKKISIFLVILLTIISSGCVLKEKNLGQMFFPVSIGFSYKNGKYQIYMQILNTSTISIVETEGSQSDSAFAVIHSEDESISQVFSNLGLKALTYVSAIKLKSVIFHTSIFEDGPLTYPEICQYIINNPVFRTKVQAYVTNNDIEEFYSVKYTVVGTNVYSHTSDHDHKLILENTNPTYLVDTLKNYYDNNRMYYFPIMDVREDYMDEADKNGKLSSNKTYFYNGICFSTYSDKRISCLSKEEALGYRWYSELSQITIDVGEPHKQINIIVRSTKWKESINSDIFNINLKVNSYINFNLSDLTLEEIKENITNKIKKDVYDTLEIAYKNDIDIYRLNDYAYRKNKDLKYNLKNVNINVEAVIENSSYYKY